ncbi:hypothetical protein EC973_001677 [Apophysomyces ossiformis]|uniref:Cyclase n=1 Tax=Apophysomyces ossiformis TaxID=679940 RepID=A0A8H7EN16_9FUNG|nr:hypothetical protein EC973_001677 [Apophysomyces ossiformis]
MPELPTFADLCDPACRSSLGLFGPKGTCWGLWGKDDEIGTLNLLTESHVKKAAACIRKGLVFPLSLPVDSPKPSFIGRPPVEHKMIPMLGHYAFDDQYDCFNPQGSSQWDGLRHMAFFSEEKFYNGIEPEEIAPGPHSTERLGIHRMAQRGIVGRAVLLDYGRWAEKYRPEFDPLNRMEITVDELDRVAAYQNVQFEQGDILIVRTGWTKAHAKYQPQDIGKVINLLQPETAGVKACKETYQWFWNHHFAAVISDNIAFEAYPVADWKDSCHAYFLAGWGMPIGELAYLEKLADNSDSDKVYEFFFTSTPINKEGGVSSPLNSICIK